MATPNSFRAPAHPTRTLEELDDSPPPYTLNPTDEITLELGPTRPFQRPPQQPPLQQQHSAQPPSELSDFAREFYAAGAGVSRSAEDLPQRPPPRHLQTQNSIPDDGKPTRTPVPGHPLLNNGRTLVYPAGYECDKCHNTGYKSYDPSNPCRRCWDKHSKPYSGPIVYSSWNVGPSNRQRPLVNLRSSPTNPSLSLSRSLSSIVNRARDDLSSFSDRRSLPPPSSVYPLQRSPIPPPPPPCPCPRPDHFMSTSRSTSSTWPPNSPPSPSIYRPGDPRIGGKPCWNCYGTGRTFGFLLLATNDCNVCGGIGRLL